MSKRKAQAKAGAVQVTGPPAAAGSTPGTSLASDDAAKAWLFDPHRLAGMTAEGYIQSPAAATIGFGTLRRMARIPPIAAIIQTRLNQISEFARPQLAEDQPGFKIVLRDRKRSPRRAEQQVIGELLRLFAHCGAYGEADLYERPTLETFLRQYMRDSLEIDHAVAEVLPDRTGRPAGFAAVDAVTIRRACPDLSDPTHLAGDVRYVQVIQSRVVAEWRAGEMWLGVRRPMTDLERLGYGYAELEELVRIVTGWLYGFDYNMAIYRNGAAVKGFLTMVGMPEHVFNAAQLTWKRMISGVNNAHVTPFFNVPDKDSKPDWTSIQLSNADMQFFEWLGWLYRLICSDYQIDPVETGFQFGNEGQKSTLSEGGPGDRIRASRNRGLHPLLRSIEYSFNTHLVWPRYPELEFSFMDEDGDAAERRIDNDAKRVRSLATLNEVRAEHDLPPVPWGDVCLDPVALQAKQAWDATQQRPDEPGPGPEKEDGDGNWDGDWDGDEEQDEADPDEEDDQDEQLLRRSLSVAPRQPRRLIDLLL